VGEGRCVVEWTKRKRRKEKKKELLALVLD
jgi:hypothetical protein